MTTTGIEIERRFLVHAAPWSVAAPHATRVHLVQVYLSSESRRAVRIRLAGERAVLTVKGVSVNAARTEIECGIDADAARAIIQARLYEGTPVEKTRSTLDRGRLTWEVDQFEGANAGLLIAEVELAGDDDRVSWDARVDSERPEWLGREITGDARFANSSLAIRPFASWPRHERDEVLDEIAARPDAP